MKYITKIIIPIVLILLSILSFYRLLRPGYPSMQDDIQVFRLNQFDKCIHDFQIPCRYIPDAGFGYGYPLYNYYSPLPYAIAEVFHLISFSYIDSIKIVFILCHIIGIFGMYFFAKHYWGKLGGIISATLFLLAPYQSVDSYVRGAIAESLALNITPFLFWALTQVITKNKHKLLFIILLASLLLSHNLTSLTFAPILLVYTLILLWQNNKLNIKNIINISIPTLLSIGISAFFTLPVIFEKNLVTVDTMTQGYFYYVIHFATLSELFISRFWGYGASLWGPIDDMSFSIGHIHWILGILLLIFFVFTRFKNKKINPVIFVFFFSVFIFSTFLTHSKSTFIWKALPFMAYYQFPWRFLASVIFSLSFIGGSAVYLFKNKKFIPYLTIIICLITIILNISYFKEDIWFPNLTDQQKLSGQALIQQSGAGLKDYWPKTGNKVPDVYAPDKPTASNNSNITILDYKKQSNHVSAIITAAKSSTITMPVVYFPNWTLSIDNVKTNYRTTPDLGLIQFDLTQGKHTINLSFSDTPIRKTANIISLLSIILAIILSRPSKKPHE